ncbi:MAG: hypothetical protein RI953_298 [Pseudomonadota bacterium]|jgi:hypothetical protein
MNLFLKRLFKNCITALVTIVPLTSFAALDDIQLIQRAGVSRSKGDLSANPSHLSFQLGINSAYKSFSPSFNVDLSHEFSLFYDTFKTRGEYTLLFPLTPQAEARVIEPAISLGACAFSLSRIRLCGGVGLSLVHLQTTIQNYQMYVGFPANLRLLYVSSESPWIFEAGARYRTFRNRIEGFVSKHEDISYLLGVGYLKAAF